MSRWSDQFDDHPIHATLKQLTEWLDGEMDIVDSEQETERRRLSKAFDTMAEALASIDPELFTEQPLTTLNQQLRQAPIWNNLKKYSTNPDAQQLREANDHLTTQLPTALNLTVNSSSPETIGTIRKVQNAYDAFCKTIEKREREFRERLIENETQITSAIQQLSELNRSLDTLKTSTEATISGWQNEFTSAQTARAEEHSTAQIDRSTKFDEALREWRLKSDNDVEDISAKHTAKLQEAFANFDKEIETMTNDMKLKHGDILEIHGLVGTDGVAGGYQKGSTDEHTAANIWRIVAMVSFGLAAVWILVKYFAGSGLTPDGAVNWGELATAASLTLVLLGAGSYAARQSTIHRETEQKMKWFALEVKAIDPFISSLPEDKRNALKENLSKGLFGHNRVTTNEVNGNVDPAAFKIITEAMQNFIKAIGKG